PYPDKMVLDARPRFQQDYNDGKKVNSRAGVEVCVQTRFEDLRTIVNPETWAACDWFWSNFRASSHVSLDDGYWSGAIKADLTLPGPHRVIQPVEMAVEITLDSLQARVTCQMRPNKQVQVYQCEMRVKKEVARPQATRVTKEALVRFS